MGTEEYALRGSAPVPASGCAGRSPAGVGPIYTIKVRGHLDPRWQTWFDGLTMLAEPDGATLLTGRILDQSALHSVLDRVQRLGLELLAVNRIESTPGKNIDS